MYCNTNGRSMLNARATILNNRPDLFILYRVYRQAYEIFSQHSCVCVCVCVCLRNRSPTDSWWYKFNFYTPHVTLIVTRALCRAYFFISCLSLEAVMFVFTEPICNSSTTKNEMPQMFILVYFPGCGQSCLLTRDIRKIITFRGN